MTPVRFATGASLELSEAAKHYDSIRRGLGRQFIESVARTTAKIATHPEAFATHHLAGIRKAFIPRFPCTVYFAPGDGISRILAIAHQSRQPDYWQDWIAEDQNESGKASNP